MAALRAPMLALVLASTLSGALAAKVTPVEQVLSMMNEMKAKGNSQMAAEKKVYAEYKEWVDDQTTELTQEMTTLKTTIEKLTAFIEKADADVKHLTGTISGLDDDIASLESDKAAATKLRNEEHAEYLKTAQDYSESVDALERAIQVMSNQDYDRAQAESMLQKMAVGTPGMRRVLAAFLQEKTTGAGEPEVAAYEFQSGGIVEILEGLLKKFKGELSDVESAESNTAHAFDLEEMHLTDLITRNTQDRAEKAATKGKTAAASGRAKGELADAQADLAEDKALLSEITSTFGVKTETYQENQKVRELELVAISKAIEIISAPDVSESYKGHINLAQTTLLQMRSSRKRVSARQRASAYLQKRAATLSSKVLSAFASEVDANPFAKVIDMIKDLVAKLKEEAAAEAEHKAWCDKELKSNKLKREKKSLESEKLATDITGLTAEIESMGEEIATLIKEQADLTKAMGEATEIRHNEKAKNTDTIADAKAGSEAVGNALVVLREFYASQGSFLQEGRQVPEMASYKGMGSAKTGVVGMLEVILSDFKRLEAETSSSETQAAEEYAGFMSDAKKTKKEKHEREVHLKLEKDQSEFDNSQLKKSKGGVDEELAKATEYFDYLKPNCLEVKVSFAERAAKRQQAIEALKEAYKMLNSK